MNEFIIRGFFGMKINAESELGPKGVAFQGTKGIYGRATRERFYFPQIVTKKYCFLLVILSNS